MVFIGLHANQWTVQLIIAATINRKIFIFWRHEHRLFIWFYEFCSDLPFDGDLTRPSSGYLPISGRHFNSLNSRLTDNTVSARSKVVGGRGRLLPIATGDPLKTFILVCTISLSLFILILIETLIRVAEQSRMTIRTFLFLSLWFVCLIKEYLNIFEVLKHFRSFWVSCRQIWRMMSLFQGNVWFSRRCWMGLTSFWSRLIPSGSWIFFLVFSCQAL